MKRCLHIALLLLESAVLAGILSSFVFTLLPDGLFSVRGPLRLNFEFRDSAARESVRDVQVFSRTRSRPKWFANEKYGRPVPMSTSSRTLSFDLPRPAVSMRIDFHFKKEVPLPDKPPELVAMEVSGCKLNCRAMKDFRADIYHTVCYEGRLPIECMFLMWEFWLLFGISFIMIGGGVCWLFILPQNGVKKQ